MAIYDAVIVGGGLGGLLCGNILSKEGLNVCLIEKNHKLGGSLQTFGRKGCIFNTGLNYTESLGEGQVLNRYFRYFGLLNKLKISKLDEDGFEIINFNDGQYQFAMGREHFIETLAKDFPAEVNGLKEYTRKIHDICQAISMYTFSEAQTNLIDNANLAVGAADYIGTVIKNNRLRQILAGNNMLYAGNAYKTPLYIHALINNSFIESAWRIVGGSHNMVNILADNIAHNGGTIIRNQKVTKFVMENGKVNSIQMANGEKIEGNHFIVNFHPDHLFNMVDPEVFRKTFRTRLKNMEDTMGMFTVHLVFKKNTIPYNNFNFYHFNQDNVWIASDYNLNKWPQNYLYMHTAMPDTSYASSANLLTYMNYTELKQWEHTYTGSRGNDYLDFKENKAEKLLQELEKQFPGIRSNIAGYYTSTPLTWRDFTGTRSGSPYGVLKDFNKPMETMLMHKTQVPNLLLTGQNISVHGILGVTISSFVTCSELIDMSYLVKKLKAC